MKNIASVLLWVVVLALFPGPEKAFGLEIYRLGGEALPRPPETDDPDVNFVQLSWSEVAAAQGGEGRGEAGQGVGAGRTHRIP